MLPPPGTDTRVADLQRRVENLESSLRAAFTTISGGRGLEIKDGGNLIIRDGGDFLVLHRDEDGGRVAVYAGDLYDSVTNAYRGTGLTASSAAGTAIAHFRTDNQFGDDTPIAEIYDGGQHIVFASDAGSGEGLARPYVPAVLHRARFADWVTTTSAAFETLFVGVLNKQHPRLYVQVGASNDTAGASGEVRVLINGVQWGPTLPTQFLIQTKTWGPLPVDGAHMAPLQVQVQARVASGSGGVRVEPSSCLGVQS